MQLRKSKKINVIKEKGNLISKEWVSMVDYLIGNQTL